LTHPPAPRANFGLFDLLGLQLSPRIRDLGKITLCRDGSHAAAAARFPHVGAAADPQAQHRPDRRSLRRPAAPGRVAEVRARDRVAAGREALGVRAAERPGGGTQGDGALRRTIYTARYPSDPTYRRKISRQLNKGESPHALKRDLPYAHEDTVRARHLEQQIEQAWCLTLTTNAVIAWTTDYFGLAVKSLRRGGRHVDDEVLAHISPATART
jgi:TnpA family transposase